MLYHTTSSSFSNKARGMHALTSPDQWTALDYVGRLDYKPKFSHTVTDVEMTHTVGHGSTTRPHHISRASPSGGN